MLFKVCLVNWWEIGMRVSTLSHEKIRVLAITLRWTSDVKGSGLSRSWVHHVENWRNLIKTGVPVMLNQSEQYMSMVLKIIKTGHFVTTGFLFHIRLR